MQVGILATDRSLSTWRSYEAGVRLATSREERRSMAHLNNPEQRLWRTDIKKGRGIYALVTNDVMKPNEHDPLVGVMESSELAEMVVDAHNRLLTKYGRHYLRVLAADD